MSHGKETPGKTGSPQFEQRVRRGERNVVCDVLPHVVYHHRRGEHICHY
jgi:hypothetical protein